MSINAKREQIRDQIRKKEREAFFLQQRLKNIGAISMPTVNQNLVQHLRQKTNIQQTLQLIIGKVSGSNHFADTMRLIEDGLISMVFCYLQEQLYTLQVLQIISYLVQNLPPQPHLFDVYAQLYNLGLLEQLAKHLDPTRGGTLSAFIIYRLTEASQDYCQAIFESRLYDLLMRQCAKIVEKCLNLESQNQTDSERFFAYVLKVLQKLVQVKQSVMDYSVQKREILGFVQFLLSKRLFLRHAFAILYECLRVDKGLMLPDLVALVNQILAESDSESRYMQNLLATVYLLTPDPSIDYSVCFKTAIQIPKTYKLLSIILDKLCKNYSQVVPTSELFWEKIMAGSVHDEDTFKRLVKVAAKLNLDQALVCRIISVSLQKQSSLGIQREGLQMLEHFVKNQKNIDSRLLEINKQGIPQILNQVCQSSNLKLKEKAAWLLDYILGPMTEMSDRIESI